MLKIDVAWEFGDAQEIEISGKKYNVSATLFEARDLEVIDYPLDYMNISYCSPCADTFRDFVAHVMMVNQADTSHPIILNEDGSIIDGKHRLAKAILAGDKTIKCKRFDKDPCQIFEYC